MQTFSPPSYTDIVSGYVLVKPQNLPNKYQAFTKVKWASNPSQLKDMVWLLLCSLKTRKINSHQISYQKIEPEHEIWAVHKGLIKHA